ncbi:hypothetical protein ABZ504_03035 [Streptomyces mirabilis]|uniref:hypothetical protein n=1 Tax=Streptomyces mirabilis TaxID=68239 RepID=UPI0033CACC95
MTDRTNTVTAGGVQLVDTPGRPALTPAEKARRSARPVRDPDPARNAAYWARIDACVDQAPPFTDEQRAVIRAQFHSPQAREAA